MPPMIQKLSPSDLAKLSIAEKDRLILSLEAFIRDREAVLETQRRRNAANEQARFVAGEANPRRLK